MAEPSWVAKCTDAGKKARPFILTVKTAWAVPVDGRTMTGSDTEIEGTGTDVLNRSAAHESGTPGVTVIAPLDEQLPQNTTT